MVGDTIYSSYLYGITNKALAADMCMIGCGSNSDGDVKKIETVTASPVFVISKTFSYWLDLIQVDATPGLNLWFFFFYFG